MGGCSSNASSSPPSLPNKPPTPLPAVTDDATWISASTWVPNQHGVPRFRPGGPHRSSSSGSGSGSGTSASGRFSASVHVQQSKRHMNNNTDNQIVGVSSTTISTLSSSSLRWRSQQPLDGTPGMLPVSPHQPPHLSSGSGGRGSGSGRGGGSGGGAGSRGSLTRSSVSTARPAPLHLASTCTDATQDSGASVLDTEMSPRDAEATRMALVEGLAAPHAAWFGTPRAAHRQRLPPLPPPWQPRSRGIPTAAASAAAAAHAPQQRTQVSLDSVPESVLDGRDVEEGEEEEEEAQEAEMIRTSSGSTGLTATATTTTTSPAATAAATAAAAAAGQLTIATGSTSLSHPYHTRASHDEVHIDLGSNSIHSNSNSNIDDQLDDPGFHVVIGKCYKPSP